MNRKPDIDTVIFDMDGTLLKSDTYCIDAIQDAIKTVYNQHNIKAPIPTSEEILQKVGKPSREFYQELLPKNYAHLINEVFTHISANEISALRSGKGKLFEGAIPTLQYLKEKGYKLAMVSNCSTKYFQTVIEVFELNKYLDRARCIGESKGATKSDIIRKFLVELESNGAAVVGDRAYDIEAGKENNCITFGCLYGYGSKEELQGADYLISNISELKNLL
jgi:phosphoglycolate phosphatase-like HAD superfamily hydrolase